MRLQGMADYWRRSQNARRSGVGSRRQNLRLPPGEPVEAVRRRGEEILRCRGLDARSTTRRMDPPAPERYEWENRRVDEAQRCSGRLGRNEVLYYTGGDLFLITIPDGQWRQLVKTATAEHDPKFSPDGKRVAFRRNWDLYVLNLSDGRETRLTSDGSDTLRNGGLDWVYPEELDLGTAYWWSPDSSAIAYLQFNVSGEPLYPHGDFLGPRAVFEPQHYPQAGENNADVRLGRGPADGGATKWLDVGDTVNQLLDRAGRLGSGFDWRLCSAH